MEKKSVYFIFIGKNIYKLLVFYSKHNIKYIKLCSNQICYKYKILLF